MSSHYYEEYQAGTVETSAPEIVRELVVANRRTVVRLDEMLGRVPLQEVVETLNSDHASEQGWQTVEAGRVYRRQLAGSIAAEFTIQEPADVRVTLQLTDEVESGGRDQRIVELQAQLAEVQPLVDLAVHDIVSQALLRALPRQIEHELGHQIVDRQELVDTVLHQYETTLYVYVHVS